MNKKPWERKYMTSDTQNTHTKKEKFNPGTKNN